MGAERQRTPKTVALVLFGFALAYFLASLRLKMGSIQSPGPGFVPVTIAVLLLASTAFHLVRVFRRSSGDGDRGEGVPEGARNYRAIVGILACVTGYPLVLESLKFLASTFFALFLMLVLLKPTKPFAALLLALGIAVGSFLMFSRLLGVGLPSGPLEILLFRIGG